MDATDAKSCKRCGVSKPHSDYYKDDRTCKPCRCEAVRANRLAKRDYYRAYDVQRTKTPERIAHLLSNTRKFRARNPEKYAAHQAVNNAVRDGRLQKSACEVCGSSRVHGHHDDYSKPLEVRWLCAEHHVAHHRKIGMAM